jgi:hypothetical protein
MGNRTTRSRASTNGQLRDEPIESKMQIEGISQEVVDLINPVLNAIEANDPKQLSRLLSKLSKETLDELCTIREFPPFAWITDSVEPTSRSNLVECIFDKTSKPQVLKALLDCFPAGDPKLMELVSLMKCYGRFNDEDFIIWLVKEKKLPVSTFELDLEHLKLFKFLLDENGYNMEDYVYEWRRRRYIDKFCSNNAISKTTLKWLDIICSRYSLDKANPETGFTPLEYALAVANESMVQHLIEERKVEVSERARYVLETNCWKIFPQFEEAINRRDHRKCQKLCLENRDLFWYVNIESKNSILRATIAAHRSEEMYHWFYNHAELNFCYPSEIWDSMASYSRFYLQSTLEELRKDQELLLKLVFLSSSTSPKSKAYKFFTSQSSDIELCKIIFSFGIINAKTSFEMRFS